MHGGNKRAALLQGEEDGRAAAARQDGGPGWTDGKMDGFGVTRTSRRAQVLEGLCRNASSLRGLWLPLAVGLQR